MQPNALALEYQRDYGTAHGDLNVLDLVNNPAANGKSFPAGSCSQAQSVLLDGASFDAVFFLPGVLAAFLLVLACAGTAPGQETIVSASVVGVLE